MAAIAHQQTGFAGTNITYQAAESIDTTTADDRVFLLVKNGSGASVDVTVTVPGNSAYGLAHVDSVVAVAAGGEKFIGPLNEGLTGPDTFGLIIVAYSAIASVTVAAVRVGDVPPSLP